MPDPRPRGQKKNGNTDPNLVIVSDSIWNFLKIRCTPRISCRHALRAKHFGSRVFSPLSGRPTKTQPGRRARFAACKIAARRRTRSATADCVAHHCPGSWTQETTYDLNRLFLRGGHVFYFSCNAISDDVNSATLMRTTYDDVLHVWRRTAYWQAVQRARRLDKAP